MDSDKNAMIQVGSGYFENDAMELDGMLEVNKKELEEQKKRIDDEILKTKKILDKLKIVLDGKFGSAVNLNYEKK